MKTTAEIRALDARLNSIVTKHVERFARTLPHPHLPLRAKVLDELERHDFHTIGISTILDAFFNNNPVLVEDVIATPSMVLIDFKNFCDTVRTKFRDRILFDKESAYLIIRDFDHFDAVAEFLNERGDKASLTAKHDTTLGEARRRARKSASSKL